MLADALQKYEVFHLVFLRALARAVPVSSFSLKGGGNLRFFFGSDRYSEDIDLDAAGVGVHELRDKVMSILESSGLAATMRTFGIERVQPPDVSKAKQTETVQRFKVHLLTSAGEDLATKIEFSRRGLDSPIQSEPVLPQILAVYRMAPLIVPHYTAHAAIRQKIHALLSRRHPEARDVFDLYVLSSRPEVSTLDLAGEFSRDELRQACETTYSLDCDRYRDTVVSFLAPEDQATYGSEHMWDQIRLLAISIIEKGLDDGR